MYMTVAQVLAALWMIWIGITFNVTNGGIPAALVFKVLPVVLGIILIVPTIVKYFM